MSLHSRLRNLEKKIAERRLDALPVFFASEEECQAAIASGRVSKHAICFIEDVPEDDEPAV